MFVRWHITNAVNPDHDRMRALLVESKRIAGKPRQQHIAFLGSIAVADGGDIEERWQFWQNATQVLDRLSNRLLPEQRAAVEKALTKRVRPLTPDQIQVCEQRAKEREQRQRESMQETLELLRSFQRRDLKAAVRRKPAT